MKTLQQIIENLDSKDVKKHWKYVDTNRKLKKVLRMLIFFEKTAQTEPVQRIFCLFSGLSDVVSTVSNP